MKAEKHICKECKHCKRKRSTYYCHKTMIGINRITGEKVFALCKVVRGGGDFCNNYEKRKTVLGFIKSIFKGGR